MRDHKADFCPGFRESSLRYFVGRKEERLGLVRESQALEGRLKAIVLCCCLNKLDGLSGWVGGIGWACDHFGLRECLVTSAYSNT